MTSTPNLSLPQRLPPYNGIFFPELQKEMNLSAEQRKRLSEVSADFWSKFKEISKENSDMTDQQKCAKYAASIDQLARDCRKQIEAVVTPQQLDAYKKAVFPRLAFELLSLAQPESRKTIGVTSGQEEKLQQIFKELSQQPTPEEMKRMEQAKDAVLAALSPQQREKLRSDVEQEIRNDEESSLSYSIGTYSGMPIFNLAVEAGSRWAPMVLPFYSELTETAIAQRLGLIADQRKQLTEVAGQHRGETVKLAGEIKKLSPDQRKRPEFQQKARRMLEAVRRRTEAVLTPQQLAALKDTVFRRRAFSTLADPNVEVKIGLNDQQKAAAKRINEEPANRQDRILWGGRCANCSAFLRHNSRIRFARSSTGRVGRDRRINNCRIVAFRSAKAAFFAERKATIISALVLAAAMRWAGRFRPRRRTGTGRRAVRGRRHPPSCQDEP